MAERPLYEALKDKGKEWLEEEIDRSTRERSFLESILDSAYDTTVKALINVENKSILGDSSIADLLATEEKPK